MISRGVQFLLVAVLFCCCCCCGASSSSVLSSELMERVKRAAAVGPVWPSTTIYYSYSNIIDFDFESRERIDAAIELLVETLKIHGQMCLEFLPRSNEPDYMLFVSGDDCSSGLGYQRGANAISLAPACRTPGTVMHEILHRLGFDHEHSRFDRDEHIAINWNHTQGRGSNVNLKLNPLSSAAMSHDTPYDYYSVTHYDSDALQVSDYSIGGWSK